VLRLRKLQQDWDELAARDPLRAILGKPGEGKPWDREEFFATGKAEIEELMSYLSALGRPARRGKALDFGCGAGRCTQALAEHFETVWGVDISPAMIELARRYNRFGDRCRYRLNESDDLRLFEGASFDLIYSNITLQHIRPRPMRSYLAEMIRLLAPGGLLVFHLPERRLHPLPARLLPGNLYSHASRLAWRVLRPGQPVIEMYGMRRSRVERWISGHGGRVLDAQARDTGGAQWRTYRYAVERPSAGQP